MAFHEYTIMKFFTSSMERLENKNGRISNQNAFLKREIESFSTWADFQNKWIEARNHIAQNIILAEQKQQLEEKISELEKPKTLKIFLLISLKLLFFTKFDERENIHTHTYTHKHTHTHTHTHTYTNKHFWLCDKTEF